jgi:hypothetical protein
MSFNFKKIFSPKEKHEENLSFFGRGMYFDWGILLAFFCVALLATAFTHGYLYVKISGGYFSPKTEDRVSLHLPVNRESLNNTVDRFEEKRKKLEDLYSSPKSYFDPSI